MLLFQNENVVGIQRPHELRVPVPSSIDDGGS